MQPIHWLRLIDIPMSLIPLFVSAGPEAHICLWHPPSTINPSSLLHDPGGMFATKIAFALIWLLCQKFAILVVELSVEAMPQLVSKRVHIQLVRNNMADVADSPVLAT